jgi:hypothetical protein
MVFERDFCFGRIGLVIVARLSIGAPKLSDPLRLGGPRSSWNEIISSDAADAPAGP